MATETERRNENLRAIMSFANSLDVTLLHIGAKDEDGFFCCWAPFMQNEFKNNCVACIIVGVAGLERLLTAMFMFVGRGQQNASPDENKN